MGPLSSTSHLSLPTWGHLPRCQDLCPLLASTPSSGHTQPIRPGGPHSSFTAQTRFSKACSRLTTVPCTPAWIRLAGPLPTAPRNCPSRSGQQGLQPRPRSRTESTLSGRQESQAKAARWRNSFSKHSLPGPQRINQPPGAATGTQ